MDITTLITTNKGKVLGYPELFPQKEDYLVYFLSHNEFQKRRKSFVCCQAESSIRMSKFKYGETNMMSTLLENNTYHKFKHTTKTA